MSRWRKSLTIPPELRDADPALLTPADPWCGDEAVVDPADHVDHALHAPASEQLSPAAHAALDAAFRAQYRAILDGRAPWSSLRPLARQLRLDAPVRSDLRPARRALHPVGDDVLAEMGEDQVPDMGVLAPDRVLGPFADESLPRRLWLLAGAVMAFAPILRQGVPPVARVLYQKPRPPTALASPVRAAARTPPMLWLPTPDRRGLTPALPLGEPQRPAGLLHAPLPPGAALLGRAVLLESGTPAPDVWLCCVLPLPVLPDPAVLERRLTLELWRVRRHDRRLTWEDLLRERGEVLYRAACEWCWWHHRSDTLRLWRDWADAG